jgi:hypothetical protein
MEEDLLLITEDYKASVRQAILKGLRAMQCSAKSAAGRIQQEESNTSLPRVKPHVMYWLMGESPAQERRPICLVSWEMSRASGYAIEGRKVKVYYGRWAEYVFRPMHGDAYYRPTKPYTL